MSIDVHPRHAALLEMVEDYLRAGPPGRSARGLGMRAANDPRMVPNLRRGGSYPAPVMLRLLGILIPFLEGCVRDELAVVDNLGEQLALGGAHQLRAFPLAA